MGDPYALQILVPVYNEGEGICRLYEELERAAVPYESLRVIYDFDGDTTLPYLNRIAEQDERVVPSKNLLGRGALNALKWGFRHCEPGPVLVLMGDCSDDLRIVPEMLALWESGATVVSPSRYMKGGKQVGGGLLKSTLSRVGGLSLAYAGFPTADPTNNFKLYDGAWLAQQEIESRGGFEVALELCSRAFAQGRVIRELPTTWRDRSAGESNFRLWAWLPHYIRFYQRAARCALFGRPAA